MVHAQQECAKNHLFLSSHCTTRVQVYHFFTLQYTKLLHLHKFTRKTKHLILTPSHLPTSYSLLTGTNAHLKTAECERRRKFLQEKRKILARKKENSCKNAKKIVYEFFSERIQILKSARAKQK